ncbi:MAG: GGDEF domain-containing protein [Sulfuricurvum sp.]|uniref:GGDEF domain-containing protein n=1 Tax=Sulfuricurvum sp. TaxID=2025608 RepID=UPI0026229EEB|nr:GGDEF domain-containing protein [Sulfuricurvum sp.]MDD2829077.1 GGDEF domain-containing protein [Sulfuricurvum sp.]MDD4948825.1 GGDEF domain-containing protein [Sulfuricurvum sp.]
MESAQINLFLSLFYKELSFYLESAAKRQEKITPLEFAELVSIATKEVLDHHLTGDLDLHEYNSDDSYNYKDIAKLSIDSYTQSNEIYEHISDKHASILKNQPSELINLKFFNEKLSDIQSHLSNEVSRANNIISGLNSQVKSLEIASTLDPLTKTFNRYALLKHFDEILSKERSTNELFILMLDIDNFKSINDHFGHIAGDKILIFLSKLLKKALRDGDKVYRFGGEEFLILLNRTDIEGAQLIAERLLTLCRQNKPLYQNEQISVTISLGLTQLRDDDTMDSLIQRSDNALYRAKENGKDRYEMEL